MNIDYKSLERRYGTLLATKIFEEIARADQHRFSFYKVPQSFRSLAERREREADEIAIIVLPKNNKAA